ncbi:hypothetical protein TraAM80_04676 [Trypanosoma rangeli]|uniref:Uncharacterized protein n=1 Tax=Trypanosoma rangeli TaxID=5698 RepID=A0A422NIF5_TRYRA|nr:uncharacterized protein TraAM80_04676 [Trypanosoma rangeli]RNF05263.1 hypothetical protein TraAM80_04676 [Trypanosoma rangeli]|eukprot:RNF05263.1 hypothetical protein TraAM80_04676 [Trypanosoma rangeli]
MARKQGGDAGEVSKNIDRYTFELADPSGVAKFTAFGKVTKDFLHAFAETKHYEALLSAFLQQLFVDPNVISEKNYRDLENGLVARVNAFLADERAHDKDRLLKGRKPVYDLGEEEEEDQDEAEPVLTEEELRQQEAERFKREQQEQERMAAREEERRRNEELLRLRARQVDAKALEKVLQGAVLLNPGSLKAKGGGKQQQQITMEELQEMESQVTHIMKEKERLQSVLHTSEDELPAKLEAAKKELDEVFAQLRGEGGANGGAARATSMQPKQMNARFAELKQKLSKQTMERNRLALQLKAQPHLLREEILSVMQKRDEARLKLNSA